MGTKGAAQVLHMDDKIGTLEPGKEADIIAIDMSHSLQIIELNPVSAIVNSCTSSDVMFTMVGGNILYENNHFTFDVDVDKLFNKLRETRDKIAGEI